jgi:hypothetical protein
MPGSEQRPPVDMIPMATQFHTSARSEIVQRVVLRDTILFLYLAGAASLFSVSVNRDFRAVLYLVPLLGLGASHMFSQHNNVIGALGRYLSVELHAWFASEFPDRPLPAQWDRSRSLLSMPGGGFIRPIFFAGLTLLVLPQAAATSIAFTTTHRSALSFVGASFGLLCVTLSITVIVSTFRTRVQETAERKQSLQRRSSG